MSRKYIERKLYSQAIAPYIDDSLIKILVGQRRVGKSYIMMQLMDTIKKGNKDAQIIYINKEDYAFDNLNHYKDLIEYVKKISLPEKKKYLFIDEVQEIDQFEKGLRSLQTKNDYDIYCTGSNASLMSGELATLLAGRYIEIRVYTLTYKEYLKFFQIQDSSDSLLSYIKFGGMPHLINLKNEERVFYEYLKNVFDSIILRDIVSRYKLRNVNFLMDLINFLADNIGCEISAKSISDYLKSQKIAMPHKTVLEYLNYIENVFFADRVKRISISGRKIFEIGYKFYFEDLGMRHSLIPFQQKDIGKVLENLVYHHLCAMQYKIWIGKKGDTEIDFVAEKNGLRVYIQVAYMITNDKTHAREFGNLLAIADNFPKMVVSMDETATGQYKGIEHIHIRKFLLEFE